MSSMKLRVGKLRLLIATEAEPVLKFLAAKKWPLHMILNTHHHHDHVGGNLELTAKFGCPVYCSSYDFSRIPGATHKLSDNETLIFGTREFQIINVPGHTLGAIAYYSAQDKLVFTGDTLFTLGCGRLFEGTAANLWKSLRTLAQLPGDTKIYSGHEYGLQNAGFALTQHPQLIEIKEYFVKLRSPIGSPGRSVPSTIAMEIRLNPFLQAQSLTEFARLRRLKDDFKLENVEALR